MDQTIEEHLKTFLNKEVTIIKLNNYKVKGILDNYIFSDVFIVTSTSDCVARFIPTEVIKIKGNKIYV